MSTYSHKLRQFADWLDARPELLDAIGEWDSPCQRLYYTQSDADTFAKLVSVIGSGTKSRYNDELSFIHVERRKRLPLFSVRLFITGVCEKKETGEIRARQVHVPKGAYQGDDGNWYVAEPVVEYECPPLLSLGEDA